MAIAFLVLAYLPSLPASLFSVDDDALINIPQIQKAFSMASLKTIWSPETNIDYYPIRDLSYMVDVSLGNGSTLFARLHQLLLFGISSVLFYAITQQLGALKHVGMATTILWMIHPYHSEMVMWLSGRKDVLAMTWALAAVSGFLAGLKHDRTEWYILSLLAFSASLLSKASFTLLPLAGGVALWVLSPHEPGKRKAWLTITAGIVLALASSIGQSWFYSQVNNMQFVMDASERIQLSAIAFARMVLGWIIPSYNVVDTDAYGEWLTLNSRFVPIGFGLWICLAASIAWAWAKKQKTVLIGLITAGALYAPVSGLAFPHRLLYSVRYFEPASLALAVTLAVFFSQLLSRRPESTRLTFMAAIIFGGASSLATINDGRTWAENISIRSKALAFAPESISLQTYLLGDLLSLRPSEVTPEIEQKKRALRNSLEKKCGSLAGAAMEPKPREFVNCASYFRHVHLKSFWENDIETAEKYLRLFRESASMIKPVPVMVYRMDYEWDLKRGTAGKETALRWLSLNKSFLNPQYRILKIVSECLSGEEHAQEARQDLRDFVERNLLDETQLRIFMSEGLNASLKPQIETCLNQPLARN